jgi:uncharacterized protein YndB with AHSA1/START domain
MSEVLMAEPGQVTIDGEVLRVVFRRRFARPIAKVWAALTVPERMSAWMATMTYDARPGGDLHMEWGNGNTMDGKVVTFDPPTTFAWTWPLYGRETLVTFELEADGDDACWFTLTHGNVSSTPGQGGGVRAGWHAHLEGLADAIDGKATPWDTIMDRNAAAQPLYPPLT